MFTGVHPEELLESKIQPQKEKQKSDSPGCTPPNIFVIFTRAVRQGVLYIYLGHSESKLWYTYVKEVASNNVALE